MSEPSSKNLKLPLMAPAQALKHITHNEALVQLDEIVQLSVVQSDLASPPPTPSEGDRYIISEAAGGDWTSREGQIAIWREGGWHYQSPQTGWRAYDQALGLIQIYEGPHWVPLNANTDEAPQFGVNTAADGINRLAIKSDAILHSHDDVTPGSGDVRHVLNKSVPSAIGSFLFQSGYSGHAEIGLIGDNHFAFKVSPDGQTWITAMVIDNQTGAITFPATSSPAQALPSGYDLYVDPVSGNDANDGSLSSPFATLAPLRAELNAYTDVTITKRAYVAGAIYTDQHLNLATLAGLAEVTFGEGAELRWTLGTDQSGVQSGNDAAAELTVWGNGLIVDGFNVGTGNGLGANNSRLIAHNVIVRNCLDGVSGHGTARVETYHCRFEACTKYAVAHVGTTTSRHVDCYFQCADSAVGIGALLNSETHLFENCEFDSPTGIIKGMGGGAGTSLTRCRLGSLSQPIVISDTLSVTDSFVHLSAQGNATIDLTRVFGRLSLRLRSGGSLSVTDSVLDGGLNAAGLGFLYSDYDPGAFGSVNITSSVVTGYSTAISVGAASRLAYWQAATALMTNNTLFGNTVNFGTHISAEVGQSITGTDTNTPTIGSRGTYDMSDWALASGAVAGFTAADAVTVGIRTS